MKKILLAGFLISSSLFSKAQVREILNEIKPKKPFLGVPVIKKKSQVFQIGMSVPNNLAGFLNFGGLGNLFKSAKSSSGPFFARYEYLIKDNIGLGASVSYAKAKQTYQSPVGNTNVTGTISGYSILFSTYYHLYTTDKFDTYTQGSVGVNIWSGSYKDQANTEVQKFTAPTPIAYNALVGLRYFFTPKINLGGEVSFSNLKFTAGISAGIKLN